MHDLSHEAIGDRRWNRRRFDQSLHFGHLMDIGGGEEKGDGVTHVLYLEFLQEMGPGMRR